ncbi:unnamed protein product [Brachionus calyciflorus]|uniref:Uncharacterized protein n=1 Tax=Brachionus calyciflorus TaxID=104777 RepID=A0A814IW81_9BILA|nr:unnamed protein product [Brachionus calyciflorus]
MIKSHIDDNQINWDENLQKYAHAYNSSVHETTRHTPFELMFGRKPKIPIDLIYLNPNSLSREPILEKCTVINEQGEIDVLADAVDTVEKNNPQIASEYLENLKKSLKDSFETKIKCKTPKKTNLKQDNYVAFMAYENCYVHLEVENELRKIQPVDFNGRGMFFELNCFSTKTEKQLNKPDLILDDKIKCPSCSREYTSKSSDRHLVDECENKIDNDDDIDIDFAQTDEFIEQITERKQNSVNYFEKSPILVSSIAKLCPEVVEINKKITGLDENEFKKAKKVSINDKIEDIVLEEYDVDDDDCVIDEFDTDTVEANHPVN